MANKNWQMSAPFNWVSSTHIFKISEDMTKEKRELRYLQNFHVVKISQRRLTNTRDLVAVQLPASSTTPASSSSITSAKSVTSRMRQHEQDLDRKNETKRNAKSFRKFSGLTAYYLV